jgi:nucleoside 2-deoxyribosyltransferase
MKIYIASRFIDRNRLRGWAAKIWEMGHEVTASWLNEVARVPGMSHDEFWRKLAMKDLQEISSSDLLIRDVHTISHTGGADTEYGFAMARHQHCMVWLVGPKRNVFHMLADKHFKTWNECLKELKKYK